MRHHSLQEMFFFAGNRSMSPCIEKQNKTDPGVLFEIIVIPYSKLSPWQWATPYIDPPFPMCLIEYSV